MKVCYSDTEKHALSILIAFLTKQVNFRENIWAFHEDKGNCLLYKGDRSKRVSVEQGPTLL